MTGTRLGVPGRPATRSRLTRAVGAGLLGLSVMLSTGLAADAASTPVSAPTSPASTTAARTALLEVGATSRTVVHAIDTYDRAAVAAAWLTRMAPLLDVPSGWTGSERHCDAGHPSDAAQQATLESINFARALAGLDAVDLSDRLSRQAQQAALIMAANDALSHTPPSTWRCWSTTGAAAAGRSDLAWTSGVMNAGMSVKLYLDDRGDDNRAVGHRRWILDPWTTTMGNGLTSSTDALQVVGPTSDRRTDPAWVAWPTAGFFPSPLEPYGRWSLSSGSRSADFSHARVRVERGTTPLAVTRFAPESGYAQPTLVFQVAGVQSTGTYTVVVRGIRGAASTTHRYRVHLFRP